MYDARAKIVTSCATRAKNMAFSFGVSFENFAARFICSPVSATITCAASGDECRFLADIVEKLFWARICAILILQSDWRGSKDSKAVCYRFRDCVASVCAGVFQQYRRISDVGLSCCMSGFGVRLGHLNVVLLKIVPGSVLPVRCLYPLRATSTADFFWKKLNLPPRSQWRRPAGDIRLRGSGGGMS
jgi:hypothetical protein